MTSASYQKALNNCSQSDLWPGLCQSEWLSSVMSRVNVLHPERGPQRVSGQGPLADRETEQGPRPHTLLIWVYTAVSGACISSSSMANISLPSAPSPVVSEVGSTSESLIDELPNDPARLTGMSQHFFIAFVRWHNTVQWKECLLGSNDGPW